MTQSGPEINADVAVHRPDQRHEEGATNRDGGVDDVQRQHRARVLDIDEGRDEPHDDLEPQVEHYKHAREVGVGLLDRAPSQPGVLLGGRREEAGLGSPEPAGAEPRDRGGQQDDDPLKVINYLNRGKGGKRGKGKVGHQDATPIGSKCQRAMGGWRRSPRRVRRTYVE